MGGTPLNHKHCCLSFEAQSRFSLSVCAETATLKTQAFYLKKKGVFYIFNCFIYDEQGQVIWAHRLLLRIPAGKSQALEGPAVAGKGGGAEASLQP